MRYSHDIVVLGGGSAGLSVASGCAQLGLKTALVEREHMGGDCLHFGCVPSKSLLHAADAFAAVREAGRFSSAPPADVQPDMSAVNAHIASVIETIAHHDSPERFRSLGAEVFLGPGTFVSPHEVDIDGVVVSAKYIVIATGSRAAVPPVPGLADCTYLTNRDVFSLPRLPTSLAVLGGGPIGVELGQAFARLGTKVTIVEMAPRILPRDDEELAAIVAARLSDDGITVRAGTRVTAVDGGGRSKTLKLEGPDGEQTLQAAEVLVAAGRRANTDTLNLEAAGIEAGRGGFIEVDDKLRTSVKSIYAIGDANGRAPFTHVAGAEAAVVVRRVALHAGGKMDYRTVPWVTYTDPELAAVGMTESAAKEAGIEHRVIRQPFTGVDRAQAERASDGLLKIVVDRSDRVIGVQIAALGAGELLAPGIQAVRTRAKLSSLRGGMVPYPTMSEVYPRAVSGQLAPKLFNPRVRKILRTLFRYRGTGPVEKENS